MDKKELFIVHFIHFSILLQKLKKVLLEIPQNS